MAQVKLVFYLPHRDNDGRDLRAEIADVEAELFDRFDGWTLTGVVKGMYRMVDRSPAHDVSNAYEVVTQDDRIAEVKTLLLDFKAKTTQEAIFFEVVRDSDVHFL